MKSIEELFGPWLYCQTKLKKTFRWSKYVQYENGKPARYNGIRRQNVLEHTLSKLLVFGMILPKLKKIFGKRLDFELLFTCIIFHDMGEGLRGQKYDILSGNKKNFHDIEEWRLICNFLEKSGLENTITFGDFEKAFLLQFALTSHKTFPVGAQIRMAHIRRNPSERNAAILFQILEKWEYLFYAHEHRNKHPTIWDDVYQGNTKLIKKWISKLPKSFQIPLEKVFLN